MKSLQEKKQTGGVKVEDHLQVRNNGRHKRIYPFFQRLV